MDLKGTFIAGLRKEVDDLLRLGPRGLARLLTAIQTINGEAQEALRVGDEALLQLKTRGKGNGAEGGELTRLG